ncbi:Serine/threonine-protein kinase B [Dolichospermum sp. UHCC 0315A]|jgi:serine/threonine protein kinase|uniref:non-specific serine/threonine protein kinase n=1 Tax=Dolichospermum flos-aquae CCAP 1403/13F TaxID=315271 RepID=A0A6H2C6K4_DOLFA|nr:MULTISPECIES: HEAT repeat domain-containing protein [Dolichospermum]QEI43176.1 Serine/threonine-protein kinase B [Dolichospermum sp. UHCC 0315A]QJB46788.1 protein kinase [Dolichospermum flos-aquae CCAP 1403/13F]
MDIKVRDIIDQRYQIVEELEQGGFGKVFLAKDRLKFDSRCVVKQFIQPYNEESTNGQKARELFKTEAKILYELEAYSQTPSLLAYLESENCIVQEFIEGKNLRQELEQNNFKIFNEKQILELLLEILPVLQEIHNRGIFHRDIKPDNIIRNSKNGKFVLIDFGISKQVSDLDTSLQGNVTIKTLKSTNFGTSGYQSPDSFSSAASDLYSLGATCFHLLSGYSPLDLECNLGDNWIKRSWNLLDMTITEQTVSILERLLNTNISSRYSNAEEVLEDIRAIDDIKRSEKINFLLSLLSSTDERYKSQAIDDLAEFGAEASEAIPQLIKVFQEDNSELRGSASITLAKIGKESVPFLAELLQHEKLEVRRRAAITLEEIGTQAEVAISQLICALEDIDPEVRGYAVIVIANIGIPAKEAIPALIERLKDSNPNIRAWSLYALGRMQELAKEAIPIILEILSQEEPNATGNKVFIAGIEALDAIGFNIDKINIKSIEDNVIRTAREWVLFIRQDQKEKREQAKQQARARRAIYFDFQPKLISNTPPQKDPAQFMETYKNE